MILVIPVFVVHEGCPHRCSFCNQSSITGEEQSSEKPETVAGTIREWLGYSAEAERVQVAFYGGSFSCLPLERQHQLMAAVEPFLSSGEVESIRLSTRPDCLSQAGCDDLYQWGVRTVELGCQSMDDDVLKVTRRGHTAEQSTIAAGLIRERGMELGLQLMVGLPGETSRSFLRGIEKVIRLRPDFVRLYPALVVSRTEMANMYDNGGYSPLSMNKAVALSCRAYDAFQEAGIRVVRMGLQPSEALEKNIVAGPYHPAFGEQVRARSWFKRARRLLSSCPVGNDVRVSISNRDLSSFVGPARANIKRLEQLGLASRLDLHVEKTLERGTLQYDLD